ncbi:MAG: hypothetical protein LBF58_09520 [Deltaproteobacteria bacterium]|jgi:hypothetical protein|nr:hypothetical protein [Deltaproteobacteria bacterium]
MPPKIITLARALWLALALTLPLALAGCLGVFSGPSGAAGGFSPPAERLLIPGVPFIPDDSSHCGPSTLAAVLTFMGRETTMGEVAVDVQRDDLRGALGPDMVIWARGNGMAATFAGLKPQELIGAIKSRKPPIVLLGGGLGPLRKGHFAVAVGYGPEGLVVNSGLIQQQVIPWKDFLGQWRKMGNFTIIVSGRAADAPGDQGAEGEVEVLSPTKVSQTLNLPEGLDVPESLSESPRPAAYAPPAPKAPAFLTGAELPAPKKPAEAPIIDFTGHPSLEIPGDPGAEPAAPEAGEPGPKASSGPGLVMEPLPKPDGVASGGEGFSETDVGLPLMLPVVPLPEEQPITGELIGSDFKGPATVPGAMTPRQAAKRAAPPEKAAPAEKGEAAPEKAEAAPVMDWER